MHRRTEKKNKLGKVNANLKRFTMILIRKYRWIDVILFTIR